MDRVSVYITGRAVKGLGVRIKKEQGGIIPNGRYYVYAKVNGEVIGSRPGGIHRSNAVTVRNDWRRELMSGDYSVANGVLSLAEAVEEFLRLADVEESTRALYREKLKYLLERFGTKRPLGSFKEEEMIIWRNDLLSTRTKYRGRKVTTTYSKNGIRIIMGTVRTFFNYWIKERKKIRKNPCEGILRKFKEVKVERHLKPEEMPLVMAAIGANNPMFWDIVRLALKTGLRRSKVAVACKENYNSGELFSGKNKNGEDIFTPIPDDMKYVFDRIQSGPVFPGWSKERVSGMWQRVKSRLRLGRVRFHDLRHSFASWYLQNVEGANLSEVQHLLGQKSILSTQRYAHFERKHFTKKVNQLPALPDFIVAGIVPVQQQHQAILGNNGQSVEMDSSLIPLNITEISNVAQETGMEAYEPQRFCKPYTGENLPSENTKKEVSL